MKRKKIQQAGLTLLVTLLLTSVLLAITASLLNITIKQYQISGISRESEIAFHAANAGIECVRYHDVSVALGGTLFDVPSDETSIARTSLNCMGDDSDDLLEAIDPQRSTGEEQRFEFDWGDPNLCTIVSIYKFSDSDEAQPLIVDGTDLRPGEPCVANFECTVIKSRGYNNSCSNIVNTRTVERELTQVY